MDTCPPLPLHHPRAGRPRPVRPLLWFFGVVACRFLPQEMRAMGRTCGAWRVVGGSTS